MRSLIVFLVWEISLCKWRFKIRYFCMNDCEIFTWWVFSKNTSHFSWKLNAAISVLLFRDETEMFFSSGLKTWYFRSIEEGSTLTIPTSKQDFLLIRVLILPFCLNSSNWIEYVCQNIHFNMRSQYTHWQKRITFKYQRKSLVSDGIQYKRCS